MVYVYVLENFAYSDFEYNLLIHEKECTEKEFKEIVKEAMGKIDKTRYYYQFYYQLMDVLEKEYGFKEGESIIPILHIGDMEKEL